MKDKQRLLVVDDLIASILEDKKSYLMTNALLLTYRAFTTSLLLMKVLRRRFRVPSDYVDRARRINSKHAVSEEDDSKVVEFNEKEAAFGIQLGIAQLVYAWMHQYWEDDFASNPILQKEIFEFELDVDRFIVDKAKVVIVRKLLRGPKDVLESPWKRTSSRSLTSDAAESDSRSRSLSKLEDVNEEVCPLNTLCEDDMFRTVKLK